MNDTASLLELTQQLLDSIASGDWETYTRLCDPTLTAFEPEARRQLVEGMDFHRFYFDLQESELAGDGSDKVPVNTTMASPHVRRLGDDVAVVSYVRLIQKLDEAGRPCTRAFEETRVWHREPTDGWRHVHFHRSENS